MMRTEHLLNNVGASGRCVPFSPLRGSRQPDVACAAAGQRILITGGNTGIGYEAALALLRQKSEVVIACRDAGKAAKAQAQLQAAVPGALVSTVPLDLTDLASVRDCASRLLDSSAQPFDVVLNNAGVMACPKMTTKDGFEYQLGTNHLGHFLLTTLLLPSLTAANKPVRVINVASAAHMTGKIDFSDLMRERSYSPWEAYGQSKLANVMFTYELHRRLTQAGTTNVTVNALHPGVVRTELGRYMVKDAWYMPAAVALAHVFFKSPEQGAQTSIYLASSPQVANISSKYFVDEKPAQSSKASYDQDVAAKLFDISMELTKAPGMPSASGQAQTAAKQVALVA